MSTTSAHYATPGIAGARVIFTLLGLAAIASLLLGTCANRMPHKSGSPLRALFQVPAGDPRTMAIAQLEQLGLDAQVQSAPGGVHNIVARKYGSASDRAAQPALLIAASHGHAAAITGALRNGAPFAHDLVILLADGQPGRDVFARHHPWATDAGMVLRFDGAGASMTLTEARGAAAGQLHAWMARTSSSLGSSALHALAARQADSMDAIGQASLSFSGAALHDNPKAAHAIRALVRHYADTPLHGIDAGPRVHFWLPLAGQVDYDDAFVHSSSRVLALTLLLACCVAWRHAGMRLPALAAATAGNAVLAGALALAGLVLPQLAPLNTISGPMRFLAMGALAAAFFVTTHRHLLARLGMHATLLGTLTAMMAALAAASLALPEASYLLAWPLLAALAAYGVAQLPLARPVRQILMAAAALPALLLVMPLLAQLAALLPPQRGPVFMLALTPLLACGCALWAAWKLGMETEAGLPWAR